LGICGFVAGDATQEVKVSTQDIIITTIKKGFDKASDDRKAKDVAAKGQREAIGVLVLKSASTKAQNSNAKASKGKSKSDKSQ